MAQMKELVILALELEKELGRVPTPEELSDEAWDIGINVSEEEAKKLMTSSVNSATVTVDNPVLQLVKWIEGYVGRGLPLPLAFVTGVDDFEETHGREVSPYEVSTAMDHFNVASSAKSAILSGQVAVNEVAGELKQYAEALGATDLKGYRAVNDPAQTQTIRGRTPVGPIQLDKDKGPDKPVILRIFWPNRTQRIDLSNYDFKDIEETFKREVEKVASAVYPSDPKKIKDLDKIKFDFGEIVPIESGVYLELEDLDAKDLLDANGGRKAVISQLSKGKPVREYWAYQHMSDQELLDIASVEGYIIDESMY